MLGESNKSGFDLTQLSDRELLLLLTQKTLHIDERLQNVDAQLKKKESQLEALEAKVHQNALEIRELKTKFALYAAFIAMVSGVVSAVFMQLIFG